MTKMAMQISAKLRTSGITALAVGGFVRDSLLGIEAKDVDLEVYGCDFSFLEKFLIEMGLEIDLVGKAFGIIKIKGHDLDISIPRRDNKAGIGHKGFVTTLDPNMSVKEAASRRDFTINSMAMDLLSGEIFDPFGGIQDLNNKILRHTSEAFVEDPLRVLRGMQFVARFGLTAAPETLEKCAQLDLSELPRERIFEEFKKLLLKGAFIGAGLDFLNKSGGMKFFPELQNMFGCIQDKNHHPEGDVLTHTGHVCDFFARNRTGNEKDDLILGFAALCHDMGKPSTTKMAGGKITAYGHDVKGEYPTQTFMAKLTNQAGLVSSVVKLVVTHMRPGFLFTQNKLPSVGAVKRLAISCGGQIDLLAKLVEADHGGRPPIPPDNTVSIKLMKMSEEIGVFKGTTKPLIQGRHLIELGMSPSPKFGHVLKCAYEAQLDGMFDSIEEGIRFIKNQNI